MSKKTVVNFLSNLLLLLISFCYLGVNNVAEANQSITIVLDADRSRHQASALAIEMGIKTAFAEIDYIIQGYRVNFLALDHRGNSTRSKLNMKKAFADASTLLVIAGMHSPPLIKNRAFINENQMLTLVPWAAGGPITRYPSADNWIFRLSIDDRKAGIKIANYAVKKHACKKPHLLLEKTPWGESNRDTMTKALYALLDKKPELTWFNWSISEANMRIKLRNLIAQGSDCILFTGNAKDGETLVKAMLSIEEKPIPILSHWGITGGEFHKHISSSIREKISIEFIQTCFSFISSKPNTLSTEVFSQAKILFPNLKTPKDLYAPVGFIHAYDLSRILIQSINQIKLTKDMASNRDKLKLALENLEFPVQGLIKQYHKPFSIFSNDNIDAHEALNINDYCMAHYGKDNEIQLINQL